MDDKASPYIFIGYGEEEFGYRFLDPKTKKLVCNRDVTFYEDQNITSFGKDERPQSAEDVVEPLPVALPKAVIQTKHDAEIPAGDEEPTKEEEVVATP